MVSWWLPGISGAEADLLRQTCVKETNETGFQLTRYPVPIGKTNLFAQLYTGTLGTPEFFGAQGAADSTHPRQVYSVCSTDLHGTQKGGPQTGDCSKHGGLLGSMSKSK